MFLWHARHPLGFGFGFVLADWHDTCWTEHGKVEGIKMNQVFVAATLLLLGTILAAAQVWPTKPVKIIVPFAAGAVDCGGSAKPGPTNIHRREQARRERQYRNGSGRQGR